MPKRADLVPPASKAEPVSKAEFARRAFHPSWRRNLRHEQLDTHKGDRKFREEHPEPPWIEMPHGFSKQHRPDLKPFTDERVSQLRGDPPLYGAPQGEGLEGGEMGAPRDPPEDPQFRRGGVLGLLCLPFPLRAVVSLRGELRFRFLDKPLLADGVYLKSTRRVQALAYVILLALLVAVFLQRRRIRVHLQETGETLTPESGRPPTGPPSG